MSNQSRHNGILVGVDGSACSKPAIEWAAREAVMRRMALTVIHVANPGIGAWSEWGTFAAPLPENVGQLQEDEARRVVDEAIDVVDEAIQGNDRLEVGSEILWSPVAPTLVDLTKEAAMIVARHR